MRRHVILVLIVALAGGVAGVFWWLRPGPAEDVLAGSVRPGGPVPAQRAPAGRLRFGNAYLDGRSAWARERFAEARRELATAEVPAEPRVESKVHRKPFTEGPWVAGLEPDLRRQREQTETTAVESFAAFFVPAVSPAKVLRYLVASEYLERVPGEGSIEEETLPSPSAGALAGLEPPPELARNQWLSRVHWKRAQALARPTHAAYVHEVVREGEALAVIEEAWRNLGGDGYVPVRMDATQVALIGRNDGTLVHLRTYYSGQSIPPFTDGLASRMTAEFYRKLALLIVSEAGRWSPDPTQEGWLRAVAE